VITFHSIRYKNFLSTGNVFTEIPLDQHKTTLIIGANGAGKSTMLDALSFCLFNRSFRKLNKPLLVNSINNKKMLVETEFSIKGKRYLIRRGIKPAVFEIFCNGKLISQDAKTTDYQAHLEKNILKLNHKSFSQIVVLGSANFTPFMQLTTQQRRDVIEDILDIQIFTVMNLLLRDRIAENKSAITENNHQIQLVQSQIDLHIKHLNEIKTDNQAIIDEQTKKIERFQQDIQKTFKIIDQLKTQLAENTNKLKKQTKVSENHNEIKQLKLQILTNRASYNKDVTFFSNNDVCPTCTQPIDQQFKQTIVQDRSVQIANIDNALAEMEIKEQQLAAKLESFRQLTVTVHNIQKQINDHNHTVTSLNGLIKELQLHISQLQTKITLTDNSQQLEQFKKQKDLLTKQKIKLTAEREGLSICGYLLKDGGIKAKIIKQYIPVINKMINKYLAAMDFFVDFTINENFEETIKSRFRDQFVYESFSEGEKGRINLALLFAWRAIAKIRNSTSTNLLVFDEIFDGSLDVNGTEDFMRIIDTLTQGTNTFIITHKGDQMADKFTNILRFEKHHNFSRIAA